MLNYLMWIFLLIGGIYCLRWNRSGFGSTVETMILLQSTSSGPKIDVSSGEQIIIVKDVRTYTNPITIYCFLAGYNSNSDILYSFCKNIDCTATYKDNMSSTSQLLYGMNANIMTKFPGQKGIRIEMNLPPEPSDSSGNFYCQVVDKFGNFMIRSNNIQIRDRIYWEQNLILTANNIKTKIPTDVQRDEVPFVFDCMKGGLAMNLSRPEWTNQEFVHPTQWSVCPIKNNFTSLTAKDRMTFSKCVDYTKLIWPVKLDFNLKPRDVSEMSNWEFFINSQGQLIIFNLDSFAASSDHSYALMCYYIKDSAAIPITTYVREYNDNDIYNGVVFNTTMTSYKRPLEAISPIIQHVSIHTRKIPSTIKDYRIPRVAIYALYKASSDVTANWMFNGGQLSSGSDMVFDKYKVEFIKNIKSSMAGVYTLIISDGPEQLKMTINVTVLGPPTLDNSDCLPLIRHVWEGDQTQFSCHYKDRPSVLKLKINAEEIMLSSQLSSSQGTLQKSYPYLEKLNFTISPSTYVESDKVTMTYTVYNLRKTIGQTVYQDHTIMFFVQNNYGLSVKSTSIYTVPKIEFLITSSPEKYNCTASCSSLEKHLFQCRINTDAYNNKELIVDHYWTINGHRLDKVDNPKNPFARYFVIDPFNADLVMLPIISNNSKNDKFVKAALLSNDIQCHLDLASTKSTSSFKFLSISNKTLSQLLKARITLDYQIISSAFIYWVIVVILVFLLIVILIALLTRHSLENRGETYQLDKIEREHGYDPEKEVQEELFKPYERQESDPEEFSAGNRYSETGESIGSTDDGELDYGLDASKFNEDGSIIGKYGPNRRNQTVVT